MSYMRAPTNGSSKYMNGDNEGHLHRFDFGTSSHEPSEDERSRSRGPPGGYGGLGASRQDERLLGVTRLNRRLANRRSGDFDSRERSQSRTRSRYGNANSQVEDILRFTEQYLSFMASEHCIPIKVALQLMDSSSLGLAEQYGQFREVHVQLQNALKVIVNEHHQGFNSSIGTFHKIQAAIQASQQRVRSLRSGLIQAKTSLASAKPELKAFATSSQSYDQMLQALDTIEQLQQVPEKLEAQVSEKRFLGAVETLQEALKLIRKPEVEDIGALSDLRVYLSNQDHTLSDILIEELHNHLYLKSPYCEERWKSHMTRDGADGTEQAMAQFLETFDGSAPMQEDTSRNPEADTFYYIQLLVEALNKLGRLDAAVNAVEHRLPVELFTVVERSHMEVEQSHPIVLRSAASKRKPAHLDSDGSSDEEQKAVLEDLLTTLFAKYEAIAEGHRVFFDVTAAIVHREGYEDAMALNRSFRELWKLLQSEIRSLLHDHLATNENLGRRSREENIISANMFKSHPRDRNRRLFKLAETDSKSHELATEREDLESIFKASVPGLVWSNVQTSNSNSNTVTDVSATGHKLLVEPSVFNMGVLLQPSLDFLHRLKQIVPANSGIVPNTLTSFLDDFLVNVFYPQLDETLLDLCTRNFTEIDAFQPDPHWQHHAQRPIFKGTVRFYMLIEAFCKLLDTLPHDQSFSQLLITQIRAYYDKCYQWSRSLLQRAQMAQEGEPRMRLAVDLATDIGLKPIVEGLLTATGQEADALANNETTFLLNAIKTRALEEADLINDRKSIAALCTLQVSMKWLAARCAQLRFISPRAVDSAHIQSHQSQRWTQNMQTESVPNGPYLPLDVQSAAGFDAVLTSFGELSALILQSLHLDLRLHLLHGVYAALDTTYALGQPYHEPDPAILTLSVALGTYDAAISANLPRTHYGFLTAHLHLLANRALASLVGNIQALDGFGCARMQLNILVLQQSLRGAMQQNASLEPAAKFYQLADEGPQAVVAEGPAGGYASEDLKALVRLCWNADRDGAQGGAEDFAAQLS